MKRLSKLLLNFLVFFTLVGFVLFNAPDLGTAAKDLGGLIGLGGAPLAGAESLYYLRSYALLFVLGILGSTPLVKNWGLKLQRKPLGAAMEIVALGAGLLVCTA